MKRIVGFTYQKKITVGNAVFVFFGEPSGENIEILIQTQTKMFCLVETKELKKAAISTEQACGWKQRPQMI